MHCHLGHIVIEDNAIIHDELVAKHRLSDTRRQGGYDSVNDGFCVDNPQLY
jgi:hypothetical protein